MKLSKYVRVNFKLYLRSLKKSPHVSVITVMAFVTLSLTSALLYNAFIANHNSTSTFVKWDDFQKRSQGRSIANAKEIRCEFNEFDLTSLKAEIRTLEESFETGHSIEGSLFGLNLKKIPYIQAQFLADNTNFIGDQSKSYNNSKCSDVLCTLTNIYHGDDTAAHLSYYWYLKTGSILSLSNKIPGQKSSKPGVYNQKEFTYQSYLFNMEELKKFYILAKSLPASFLHTPLLKSIHKVPGGVIEGSNSCAQTTKSGAILIGSNCLGYSTNDFLKNITTQIADFVDIEKGRSSGLSSISSSKQWREKSLWTEKSFYDFSQKQYHSSWRAYLDEKNFVTQDAKISPSNQLKSLLTSYRYDHKSFVQKTPIEIQNYIKTSFFNNESFDDNGLYNQFLEKAVTSWSKEELSIWDTCLQNYLPEGSTTTARELASKVDSPLFTCVEKKIPSFVNKLIAQIKTENYEGCKFFNDEVGYSHLSEKFYTTVDKYLQEKVLKRKIELQNHGEEVLLAQTIKDKLVSSLDPIQVYINCYENKDQEACFNKKVSFEVNKTLIKNKRDFSKYYYQILTKDLTALFKFDENKQRAHSLSRKFLAPFYNKISFAATNIWESCKEEKFSETDTIKLPLKFSGGKNFVNAKLLNCINDKMDDEIYNIVELKAYKSIDEKPVIFVLTSSEQEFAKSFMEKRLVQIFTSLSEQEQFIEKQNHAKHFKTEEPEIVTTFLNDESFFDEVYSFKQVTESCLERVSSHYPKSYFMTSKKSLDKSYGKSLCHKIINHEKVSQKVHNQINKHWNDNKDTAKGYLNEYFTEYAEDCKDDYPIEHGRGSARNKRMRNICIQESFQMALIDALTDWREDDGYEHFSDRETVLGRELASLKTKSISEQIR